MHVCARLFLLFRCMMLRLVQLASTRHPESRNAVHGWSRVQARAKASRRSGSPISVAHCETTDRFQFRVNGRDRAGRSWGASGRSPPHSLGNSGSPLPRLLLVASPSCPTAGVNAGRLRKTAAAHWLWNRIPVAGGPLAQKTLVTVGSSAAQW